MYGLGVIKAMSRKGARNSYALENRAGRTIKLSYAETLVLTEALAVFRPDNAQDEDTRQSLIVRLGRKA